MHGVTYGDAYNICANESTIHSVWPTIFKDDPANEVVQGDLYHGGIFLGCKFGFACTIIWAVGILAAGQVCMFFNHVQFN